MPETVIPFGNKMAQKKWSGRLFIDTINKSYWNQRFVGEDENSIIQRLTDLESGAGDRISFDLSVQLRGKPVYGDARAKGTEEDLKFFTDEVSIDQVRHPISLGGRMTRKRTAHNLRTIGKNRLSDYWSQYMDQLQFIYLSGARGINEDYLEDAEWSGLAQNSIDSPDPDHIMYPAGVNSKESMTEQDTMSREVIERAAVKARMMRAKDPKTANMMPVNINSEKHYVMIMTPYQEFDLRTKDEKGWLEIQKAAAGAEGRSNPIFKGGLGMVNNVVLHSHESVIRFDDYGPDADVSASRALFLGAQAGVVAFGTTGGRRFTWQEEVDDYESQPTINAGTIMGFKKTKFNGRDFGVIAIDTAATDPNTVLDQQL